MEIRLPETIDCSTPGRYALRIDVYPERFIVGLHPVAIEQPHYECIIRATGPFDAFSQFREALFDNEWFNYAFSRVLIVNHSSVFACVPNLLFNEEDKEAHLHFLFAGNNGIILHQTLPDPAITLIHSISDEVYGFLHRTFPEAIVEHYTAALLERSQEALLWQKASNQMIIHREATGITLLCYSRRKLVLCNHFDCGTVGEASYYVLYVYRQLQLNPLTDPVYLMKADDELEAHLSKYVKYIELCEEY